MTPAPARRSPVVTAAFAFGVVAVAVIVLFAIFSRSNAASTSTQGTTNAGGGSGGGGSGKYVYQAGDPGIGKAAPSISLASSSGAPWSLQAQQGKTVLLYFQEGVGCQPCFDQIKAIEADPSFLRDLGVDQLVSITGSPAGQIAQKTADMGISTTVLSDADLAVSRTYHANDFGMMGDMADGHTFILVGPDGRIRWRADYGGKPNYTMFVPPDQLRADLRAGAAK